MSGILVTGFEGFGDYLENPSEEIAWLIDDLVFNGQSVRSMSISVNDDGVESAVSVQGSFKFVISMGLSAKSTNVILERRAKNVKANLGKNDFHAIMDGPEYIYTQMDCNVDGTVGGDDAGTFYCNELYYRLLANSPKCLFIHIPPFSIIPKSRQLELVMRVIEQVTN